MSRDRYSPTGRRDAARALLEIRRLADGATRWVDSDSWRRVAGAADPTAILDEIDASPEWVLPAPRKAPP